MVYIMCLIIVPIILSISRLTSSWGQWLALSHMFVQTGAAHEYQLHQALEDTLQVISLLKNFAN